MKQLKKIGKTIGYLVFLMVTVLLLFEFAYRYSFIDFYNTELKGINSEDELSLKKPKTLLVFGDSFTADKNSYLKILGDSLPGYNIINSAIPGTSVFHTKTFFNRRLKQFNPDHILIQLYVGNDLIDYKHPVNWSTLPFLRNLYWNVSDNLIGLQYINMRMGQFKASSGTFNSDPKTKDAFNVDTYNHREKLYFKGDPMCLYNAISAKESQEKILNKLIEDLQKLLEKVEVKTTILIIPHGAQVSQEYQENMIKIGASFKEGVFSTTSFGFYESLKNELLNTKVVTPLGWFRNNNSENLYFPNDPHLSETGQKELAKYLLQEIDF